MSEHIVENNPKREFLFALGGVGLFLGIVLLIGISGFLRPAGEHITAETTEAAAAAETDATAEAATAETAAAPVAETDAAATATPADATVTPAADTDGTVVAAESGTATAEGTVNQAAVADDADLTATPADADLDAGKTGEITHTLKAEE
ncbi:hypothetical protein [Psychrobacter immobilis]|uniref:hypothetical protein n=1 Tax=Psychrobacter immobilis TaxID=498 RepID=UPI001917DD93|nr:hypothetical protein [Psychrobacter immobilis]